MYKVDELALMTGTIINLEDPVVRIHQPTLEEIALIGGEKKLFQSLNMFYIDSAPLMQFIDTLEDINEEERAKLKEEVTPYDTLLFLLKVYAEPQYKEDFNSLLELIQNVFQMITPNYTFVFNVEEGSMLLKDNEDSHSIVVDREFFIKLKDVSTQVFLLNTFFKEEEKKELSAAAQKIADKMAEAEKRIQEEKAGEEVDSQFALIISILGIHHPIDYLRSLTIYQIYDQFERFNLYNQYDQAMQAALAGASDVKMVNWYKKI